MASQFGQIGVDLSRYQRQAPPVSPLESLIAGFNQGTSAAQLPQQLQDQELLRQLQMASIKQKLMDLQDPNQAVARQVAQQLAIKGAIDPTLGIGRPQAGLAGEVIANPGTQSAVQEQTLGLPVGYTSTGAPAPFIAAQAPEAPITVLGVDTGLTQNPVAAQAALRQEALSKPYNLGAGENRMLGSEVIGKGQEKPAPAGQSIYYRDPVTNRITMTTLKAGESLPEGAQVVSRTATGETAGGELDDAAAENLARTFNLTGKLPPMGMGKQATADRRKVFQIANKLRSDSGATSEDVASNQASYKANVSELVKLQTRSGLVEASMSKLDYTMDLVGKLSSTIDNTGVPILNKWINVGKRSVTGDPKLAAYDAAIRTAVNEYASITSNAAGSGVTSDTARKHAEDLLNAAQTPEQVEAVIRTLKQDADFALGGLHDTITQVRKNISGNPASKAPSSEGSTMIKVVSPAGKRGEIPASKLDAALKAGYKRQ